MNGHSLPMGERGGWNGNSRYRVLYIYAHQVVDSYVVQEEARILVSKSSNDLRTLALYNEVSCAGEGAPGSDHHDLVKSVSYGTHRRWKDVLRQTG